MSVSRQHHRTPLAEVTVELDASADAVRRLLLSVALGQVTSANGWLVGHRFGFEGLSLEGGPVRFAVRGAPSTIRVDVDDERSMIAMEGGWWYRGEYWVQASRRGTRITHRVVNIAGAGTRWLVPLANRGFAQLSNETKTHADALAHAVSAAVEDLGDPSHRIC
ncbi:hypothetical protein ACFWHT_02660 [Microbacterium sp. NPDC058342]|uniref:hypothetical protein n=1 Tax=Microbacterium sp. NPDC058342 TaxID=3346454 RepID=UPI00365F33E6